MSEQNKHGEVFSQNFRAGNRTYFFDVKTTRSGDFYITITESKKRNGDDGRPIYEKHKIFLFREDFDDFRDFFEDSVRRIDELAKDVPPPTREELPPENPKEDKSSDTSFSDINFDDLK